MSWTFKEWYGKNAQALNDKRKERYRTDPEYREQVKAASALRRQLTKPEDTRTGLTVTEVCDVLGVTTWTLNRWKNAGYIPVETLRNVRFSQEQLNLLGLYQAFFEAYPRKAALPHQDKLEELISVVHHNWGS